MISNYDYDYGFNQYEGYEDEYCSVNDVVENMEHGSCTPTIMEVISEQDEETGKIKETKVYNCHNCTNYDCQYFYEIEEIE